MKQTDLSLHKVVSKTAGGVKISICVLPRSSRSAIVGVHNSQLKIKLTKPPVDGKANAECCRFIARVLRVPKTAVRVIRGMTARNKVLIIDGITETDALKHLSDCIV